MTAHPLLPAEVQAEYRRLEYWEGITLAEIVAERAPCIRNVRQSSVPNH